MKRHTLYHIAAFVVICVLSACSTTSGVPDGDQLYTGLTAVKYNNYNPSDHATEIQAEVDAALACAPNGALFGSSYYRTPFPFSLWIWNACHDSSGMFKKWATKTFGKAPVLMSRVNPALRASVAQTVLRNHGYFRGKVSYDIVPQKNPKKGKIGYDVDMGHLFTLDSISYSGFKAETDSLIQISLGEAAVCSGDPFDVTTLDEERQRISRLLRNNGYFYYQQDCASYLADTISVPGRVQLQFKLADGLPERVQRKYYMGNIRLELRKKFMETLTDSVSRRRFTVLYNGKRSPIRSRVIMKDMKLRPGQPYSYEKYEESNNKIASNGIFSMVDFKFTPRDSSLTCDTLDLTLSCVFDKPYDVYVETNYKGRTSGRTGPGLAIGFTKRNAFRGGELLDINLNGNYEWQTGHNISSGGDNIHSYEYGADVSLNLPRLLLPFNVERRRVQPGQRLRRRFFSTPTTLLKASTSVINRAGFFKRHIVSGELTYTFQTSAQSAHQISPLTLEYEYMTSHTKEFDDIMATSPYLQISMKDQFIPKMRYSYVYTSPASFNNPIFWQLNVSEAGNVLALGYSVCGKKWGDKDKTMFKNPFAQFFKIDTEFRKTWAVTQHSDLVAHVAAGAIWSYGNSSMAPWSEQFYVGGANSIRAFTVRSIGPGGYVPNENTTSYLDQTGDIKFLANLEYRPRLFGNLYGAVFLDAGNVWTMHNEESRPNGQIKASRLLKDMALGTGIGVRYDLDFFVIRIDWGIGLHVPYKSGFFNIGKFKDNQSIHLAIGYPF